MLPAPSHHAKHFVVVIYHMPAYPASKQGCAGLGKRIKLCCCFISSVIPGICRHLQMPNERHPAFFFSHWEQRPKKYSTSSTAFGGKILLFLLELSVFSHSLQICLIPSCEKTEKKNPTRSVRFLSGSFLDPSDKNVRLHCRLGEIQVDGLSG